MMENSEKVPDTAHQEVEKESHSLHINYIYLCAVYGTTPEVIKKSEKSFRLASEISTWLKGYEIVALATIVCCCSINVLLDAFTKQRCHLIVILLAGGGKSQFLNHLKKCNPKMFQRIDDKPYESLLVKKGSAFFHRKVCYHSDLSIAFTGLRKQQFEQLIAFFQALGSDQEYCREHDKIEADSVFIFGLALQHYKSRREAFDIATFSERFAQLLKNTSEEEKRQNLDSTFQATTKKPDINLPYYPEPQQVTFVNTEQIKEEIIELSLEMDSYGGMSHHRMKNFIILFMQSNALLNGRNETCKEDLEVFKIIFPYLKASTRCFDEVQLLKWQLKEEKSPSQIQKTFRWSKSKYYRLKKLLEKEQQNDKS